MGLQDRIKEIEAEMARTQKNKATEHHLGLLKAKIARLRQQLLEGPKGGKAAPGEGFDVMKSGAARVAMIGFPSVGKSTLLSGITETKSEVASYEFTTLTAIPGVLRIRGAEIQLLDLPGIIEGASEGKGRGRQVIAAARQSDVILMMMDASKGEVQREKLTKELEAVGIRLNKERPNIYFKPKKAGGISINATCKMTRLDNKTIQQILHHEYKIFNAEVLFREDSSVDDFIDVVENNRQYLPCIYCYTKIDTISLEEMDYLVRQPRTVCISTLSKWNLDLLEEAIWETLSLVRVYTKRRGEPPDFSEPIILRKGATVQIVCHSIHRTLVDSFNYALVWGTSAKHRPQRVGQAHMMQDEDVIQIFKKSG